MPSLGLAAAITGWVDLLTSKAESGGTVGDLVMERVELLSVFSDQVGGHCGPILLLYCRSGLVKRTGLAPRIDGGGGRTLGEVGTNLAVFAGGSTFDKAGLLACNLNCGVVGIADIGVELREGTVDPDRLNSRER